MLALKKVLDSHFLALNICISTVNQNSQFSFHELFLLFIILRSNPKKECWKNMRRFQVNCIEMAAINNGFLYSFSAGKTLNLDAKLGDFPHFVPLLFWVTILKSVFLKLSASFLRRLAYKIVSSFSEKTLWNLLGS